MFNWLQNLLGNIDPFGIKANAVAQSNLAAQQRLFNEQNVQKQQEIAIRQQQPGGFPTSQYQQANKLTPAVPNQQYALPLTPASQINQPQQNQGGDTELQQLAKTDRNPVQDNRYRELLAQQQPQQSPMSSVDELVNAFIDPVGKTIEAWSKKLEEFDKNNPFAFDEALAKASAGERLNPYYDATLNEFMTGIRRSSARSVEDMTRTVGELNADATKLSDQERLATQEAIRSSEEGFAGAGLFFSGKRARQTGLETVQGNNAVDAIDLKKQRGIDTSSLQNTRLQEDIALQEARTKRLTEAERTTALQTDIAGQKKESAYRRGLEQLQFAGNAPGLDAGTRMSLENQFMSGLR